MNRIETPSRPRAGFTLVELLVALTIFSVGLLAMAATSSVIMQMLAGAQARTVAAGVAESRFEQIAGTACINRTSGTVTSRNIIETWTRFPLARADDVTVAITYLSGHRSRTETFRSYIPC
jgi:prepilin-type N-terminal cleavage/methylation domain-containing protein